MLGGSQRQLAFRFEVLRRGKLRGPKVGPRPRVRPTLRARHPVHVTLRARASLPSLRSDLVARRLRAIVEVLRIDGFRVVHYSIQRDHIHMIVEAHDKRTLSSGVRSFVIRMAKRLNALFRRKGSLWGDRYHRHDLTTPRQVRNALAYVYANFKKRGPPPRTWLLRTG